MLPARRPLPDTRTTRTRHFSVAGFDGYLHVDLYPDGSPGELRITMTKPGSLLRGLMDTVAASISVGLQHGVPLHAFRVALGEMQFEPAGWTNDPEIERASSLIAYVVARLALWFPDHATAPQGAEGPPLPAGAAMEPPAGPAPGIGDAPAVAPTPAPERRVVAAPELVVVNDMVVPAELADVVRRSCASWPSGPTSDVWAAIIDGRKGGAGRPHHDAVGACPRPWWAPGDLRAYCTCEPLSAGAGA